MFDDDEMILPISLAFREHFSGAEQEQLPERMLLVLQEMDEREARELPVRQPPSATRQVLTSRDNPACDGGSN